MQLPDTVPHGIGSPASRPSKRSHPETQPVPATGLSECGAPPRLLRDRVPERHDLEPSRSRQGCYRIGSGYDESKDRTTTANSRSSNYRVANGSPPEAGDPPGYSMFQERAPWTLVTGEEHFTHLGYHSERRCQGPSGNFWAMAREVTVMVVLRSHRLACPVTIPHGVRYSATSYSVSPGKATTRYRAPRLRESCKPPIQWHPS